MKRRTFLTAAAGAAAETLGAKLAAAQELPNDNSPARAQLSRPRRLTKAEAIFARDAAYKPRSNTAAGRRILAEAPANVRGYRVFAEFLNDVAYRGIAIADPELALPENVVAYQDIHFGTVNGRDLRLDLFVPRIALKPAPLVVVIHGGCWIAGSRKGSDRQAVELARRGYAAASIDYRLSEEAAYPAAVDDCRMAIRWLKDQAHRYNVDTDRIALLGGSAGGHLAQYVGYSGQTTGPDVRAIVSFYGWSDLTHPTVREFYWNEVFLGKKYEEAPELYRDASPITHAGRRSPPTLLLHGTIDPIVPPNQSVMLMEKLEANSVPYVYAPFLGLYHAFLIDEAASERAMYFVDRFLAEYLVS
jgi:acetyl esterase/lipase